MGLFSSRHILGVDLGHASVKVVGVEIARQPKVVGYSEVALDAKYLQKEGFNDPAVIAETLKEAMRTAVPHQIKASEAYATVSEALVFRKILELPVLATPEEYQQVIRTEAAEYLPDNVDSVELDYQLLGPPTTNGMQEVMVVAVGKRVIQDLMAVFSAAKLPLHAIDPKPSAVGRGIVGLPEKTAVVLADIGSETTSLSIYDQHMVWVTGTINMGGSMFKDDTGAIDPDRLPARLKQFTSSLLDELDHVLKFYANRTSKLSEVKEIRVTGGGSLVEGLIAALQEELEQKVVAAKPVIQVPAGLDARFYGALGSALYPLYDLV